MRELDVRETPTRVDEGRKAGSSLLAINMQGTNRSGRGEKRLVFMCDSAVLSYDYLPGYILIRTKYG